MMEPVERDASSDEDDDRQHLIDEREAKHSPTQPQPQRRPAFDVEDLHSGLDFNLRRRFRLQALFKKFNKRYLFAIFLPLFIVLVYFLVDFRNLFSANLSTPFRFDSITDRMRESELRALYLLRQQRQDLFSLWSQNFPNSSTVQPGFLNSSSSNLSSSSGLGTQKENSSAPFSSLLEDVKSAVLRQISLNRDIQRVLLSPHRTGNSSELDDELGDPSSAGFGLDRCRKVDQSLSGRRTIEWKPRLNKFLLAICVSGQMSNHLICLEKHMFFAAVLNRVLVLPSSKVDYQYSRVLDIDHINECLGRKVVMTFDDFAEMKKSHMRINRFICYFSGPEPCYMDDERVKKLKTLGVSLPKLESPWVENTGRPSKKTIEDIMAKFSSDDDVIAIGDVFYADVEQEWVMQPGGPLAHKCKTLIEPSRLIMVTAQRFVQTFLGRDFIALHFRRHGFLKFCNAKRPSCFYPIPQAADCIKRVAERADSPVIYLSTDAAESETSLLQSLIMVNGKTVPLVKRPARNSAEKWDALLYRKGLEGDSQVEAMLDKTICAMSSVFIGASGSTFTEDILRLRRGWGSASLCDEYLCQGEEPNFIADDE